MRSFHEQVMYVLVTAITNVAYVPVALTLLRQGRDFEAFVAFFTTLTSFMYHLCDSVQRSVWMTAGQWHRLDNIGSIMAFSCWFIYLARFRDPRVADRVKYTFLMLILICQEKGPWDERFTFGPILTAAAIFLIRLLLFSSWMAKVRWRRRTLTVGLGLLVLAVLSFIRGLDDATDPYRIFHGGWHFFGGVSSYYLWQVKRDVDVAEQQSVVDGGHGSPSFRRGTGVETSSHNV